MLKIYRMKFSTTVIKLYHCNSFLKILDLHPIIKYKKNFNNRQTNHRSIQHVKQIFCWNGADTKFFLCASFITVDARATEDKVKRCFELKADDTRL